MDVTKKEFIEFLLSSNVLSFGAFVTKSGRNTPYFINTGKLNTGNSIASLGRFYARHIEKAFSEKPTVVFGPAYKGIPLAVSTASALSVHLGKDVFYSFDRKEEKDHGDKGSYVGKTPSAGDSLIIVEDVITAGTTLKSVVPKLRTIPDLKLIGVVIAVDRCERGDSSKTALSEISDELAIAVKPVVTIHDIIEYLSLDSKNEQHIQAIKEYLSQYGA